MLTLLSEVTGDASPSQVVDASGDMFVQRVSFPLVV